VVIPGVEIKHNGKTLNSHTTEDVVINTIDWLRFFGLYLADGSYSRCSGSGYTVSIKQHNRDRDKVRKILSNLPFKFSVVIRFQICIFDILNTAYCDVRRYAAGVVIRFQICIFDILNTAMLY